MSYHCIDPTYESACIETLSGVCKVLAQIRLSLIVRGNSYSRQVAIRRSFGQVFCAYFANNFTHPYHQGYLVLGFS